MNESWWKRVSPFYLTFALLSAACGSADEGDMESPAGNDAASPPGGEPPSPGGEPILRGDEPPLPGGDQPPLGGTTTQDAAPAATPDAAPVATPDAAPAATPDAAPAAPPDASLPAPTPPAAPPDASLPAPTPPAAGPAETCEGAPFLAELSVPMALPAGGLTQVTSAPFGASNDYNPLQGAGLPPACSFVYDARGRDVVYAVHLEPGQTLVTRTVIEPDGLPAGIYLLEDCETGRWPDVDGSTLCGNNEYHTQGRCNFGFCDPLDWRFTWPVTLNGVPTAAHTFFLVVDQVDGDAAQDFTLEWGLLGP